MSELRISTLFLGRANGAATNLHGCPGSGKTKDWPLEHLPQQAEPPAAAISDCYPRPWTAREKAIVGGTRSLSNTLPAPDETILPLDETIFGSPRNRPETVGTASSLPRIAEKATGELQMNHSIYSAD